MSVTTVHRLMLASYTKVFWRMTLCCRFALQA